MTFNLRHQYVFILSLFMKTVTLCNSNNDTFKKQHLFKTGADSFVHTRKKVWQLSMCISRLEVQERKNSVSKELEDYKLDNQRFMQEMNNTITQGKQDHISLSNEVMQSKHISSFKTIVKHRQHYNAYSPIR